LFDKYSRIRFSTVHRGVALLTALLLFLSFVFPQPGFGYAVLSHQALVDVVWESYLKPTLLARYPNATEEELSRAQAYAYGGSIIQDLGYYPHGNKFFSDLTHYVRSGDFVMALLRDSKNIFEYGFALGALSHYATDNAGHRLATNRAVPILYPNLKKKFGDVVTYEDDPLAHVKTEFGFDVLQMAQEHYAPESYHDFIGFEVSKRLMEEAFQEVYCIELRSVLEDEERALTSYRHDVSKLIPSATRIAWSLKRKEIRADVPGATRDKFLYNLSRSDFETEWGDNYDRPGRWDSFLAFVYKLVPKFGPLRVFELKTPTPETEKLFEESFNSSVEECRKLLREESQNKLHLPNVNFDVGSETVGGKYRLNDDAHARLLHQLAENKFQCISPELRAEILTFFENREAPFDTKKDKKAWERVLLELQELNGMTSEASRLPTQRRGVTSDVKASSE